MPEVYLPYPIFYLHTFNFLPRTTKVSIFDGHVWVLQYHVFNMDWSKFVIAQVVCLERGLRSFRKWRSAFDMRQVSHTWDSWWEVLHTLGSWWQVSHTLDCWWQVSHTLDSLWQVSHTWDSWWQVSHTLDSWWKVSLTRDCWWQVSNTLEWPRLLVPSLAYPRLLVASLPAAAQLRITR